MRALKASWQTSLVALALSSMTGQAAIADEVEEFEVQIDVDADADADLDLGPGVAFLSDGEAVGTSVGIRARLANWLGSSTSFVSLREDDDDEEMTTTTRRR